VTRWLSLLAGLWPLVLAGQAAAEDRVPWQAGGFLDLAYGQNFNYPDNHQWRSKETTTRTNEVSPNMGYLYAEKDPTKDSPWGLEFAFQGGNDTRDLVPRENPMGGADGLRHVARANVSYLAPVGSGLILTGGVFRGFKNYESFYAKSNYNYTRAYLTDFNPNFMLGFGAEYEPTESMEVGFFVVNEYHYLAHANDQPSYAASFEWRATRHLTAYQNLYYGADQRATSLRFWRAFSDSTLEWRSDDLTLALSYDVGTERIADQEGAPRAFWMGSALFTQYHLTGPWSVAVRPEFFWDRNGRMTQFQQMIWANTTTLEYRKHQGAHAAIVRLEHRYDESRGKEGGFFVNGLGPDGLPRLTPGQHVIWLSVIWAFDL
jgi:hypothetical protein